MGERPSLHIGVDLDGCLYDFAGALRRWLVGDTSLNPADYPDPLVWDFPTEQWGMTADQFTRLCDDAVDDGYLFRVGDPIDGGRKALETLKAEGHSLHIVTNRSFGRRSVENTEAWLHEHEIPHDTLTFAADKTIVRTDIFIEDNVDNHLALRAAGTRSFLMQRPWNEHISANSVLSWPHFVMTVHAVLDMGERKADALATTKATAAANPKDLVGLTKPPLRLVPPAALLYMSKVMELGADKYGPYNWRTNSVRRTVYLEAAMRHILQALDGTDADPESGMPHEAHAAACMAILLDGLAAGNLIDDRPEPGPAADVIAELTAVR